MKSIRLKLKPRKIGNSYGVIIPINIMNNLGDRNVITIDVITDEVDVITSENVITPDVITLENVITEKNVITENVITESQIETDDDLKRSTSFIE